MQTTGPNLEGQKPKERINLEAWEKDTSNNKFLKKRERKKEKAEKYYTNEGTNQKHRSSNK